MSALVEQPMLSRAEARSLTDEVKNDGARLWRKVIELRDGHAHIALGYGSWRSYWAAEFGEDGSRGDQLARAGKVMKALGEHVPALPSNDRQARELAPLLDEPEQLREVWKDVVEANPNPTAADIRAAVVEVRPDFKDATARQLQIAEANKQRIYKALSGIAGFCVGLDELNYDRAFAAAAPNDFVQWESLINKTTKAMSQLRRAIKEAKA